MKKSTVGRKKIEHIMKNQIDDNILLKSTKLPHEMTVKAIKPDIP